MLSRPFTLRRFGGRILVPLCVACLAVTAVGGAAVADNTVIDGDNATPVAANGLDLGTVCAGSSTQATVLVAASRNGSSNGTNTFSNGATLTAAVDQVTGSGLSAAVPSDANTITLPSDWTSLTNNTMSSPLSATLTLDAPTTTGAYSGTVRFQLSGLNTSGTTIARNATLNVTATVSAAGSCAPAPVDSTPPTVTVSFPSPINGSNGWFNAQDVTPVVGTVTAADVSGVTAISCDNAELSGLVGLDTTSASGTLTLRQDGVSHVVCTATDSAGNSGAAAETSANTADISIDTAAPVITDEGVAAGTAGNSPWYISAVTEGFSASDATSGLADCPDTFTQDSGTAEGADVTIASGPCSDVAGNINPGITSAAYAIDLGDPYDVTFVNGPADGGSYYFGFVPDAPTCTADDDISGLHDCTVTGYSSAVGPATMTATATDNAGRQASLPRSYRVLAWTFVGFFQPVDNSSSGQVVYNTVKGGSTVPLKFQLFAGPTQLTDVAEVAPISVRQVSCDTSASTDPVETTAAGGTSLRYDSTAGQYVYNWQTPKTSGACYAVTVSGLSGSGAANTAYFRTR